MTVYEMEGFFRGKCLPGDMEVSEGNTQYLVRKLPKLRSQNADMAVQLANAESECRELTAESSGLKVAFDKPQVYLSWHTIPSTWEEPFPCGEYLGVHDGTGHESSDGTDCWPVFVKPEIETPVTDAFLAEMRAQGTEMFALMFAEEAIKDNNIITDWETRTDRVAFEYAELLREGADR